MSVPVPVDVTELLVRVLRRLLADQGDPVAVGVQVSTETGRNPDGGPPSLPWLLVALDGHTWSWPAVQRAVIRLSCWHRSEYASKALVAVALGLLCSRHEAGAFLAVEPVTAPLGGIDPYTHAPLATAAVAVHIRTPTRS